MRHWPGLSALSRDPSAHHGLAWNWQPTAIEPPTGGVQRHQTAPADMLLELGVRDPASYGNNFDGQTNADGTIEAAFAGTDGDLILSFAAFDVDFVDEVELLVNGQSLGYLAPSGNNAVADYQFVIPADLQQDGDNILTFVQRGNIAWTWGVRDVLLEQAGPAATLTIGQTDPGTYGNNFDGKNDADGRMEMRFVGTEDDLLLTFNAFDIESDDQFEVLLNGRSLGFLGAGIDGDLQAYDFRISAADQQAGDNILSFVQHVDPGWTWGIQDVRLAEIPPDPAVPLSLGVKETSAYGNNFLGQNDFDGRVDAVFEGRGHDLLLTFGGFDIDFDTEIEVLLNGGSLGFLTAGGDDVVASYEFFLATTDQLSGENVLSFVQRGDVAWTWGVTDILLEAAGPATELALGVTDTGKYGNNFLGLSDSDGTVAAQFTGTDQALRLTFDAYDIESGDQFELLLNGQSLGFLTAGLNNGTVSYAFTLTAADQLDGDNILQFVQHFDTGWTWGISNLLLSEIPPGEVLPLTESVLETGIYGNNFNGTTDPDGRVEAGFDGTGRDLLLTFDGYDVDTASEIEVFLNGQSLGFLAAGVDSGLTTYQFQIAADVQLDGDNLLSFVQQGNLAWNWGVTDILLEANGPATTLTVGEIDSGKYGNNFFGLADADGRAEMAFAGAEQDLLLTFDGYDIESGDQFEVLLNGESLGFLAAGLDNDTVGYEFVISAEQQLDENILTFVQHVDTGWTWGLKQLLLTELPEEGPIALELGVTETASFGNNFDGQRDFDGVIEAEFEQSPHDLRLRFKAFDVDSPDEIEVLLNGQSLGYLDTGVSDDLAVYEFQIDADVQQAGINRISFVQRGEVTWNWGVTDILLDPLPPSFRPSDSDYGQQWQLQAIGDIERVWADYTGDEISVAIYDDGLERTHHDLNDTYDADKHVVVGGEALDPLDGGSAHGTSVAGIIAAEANGTGIVGIAFDAGLTGVNIFSGAASANGADLSGFGDAMMQMADFDVVNHSWGWAPAFSMDAAPPADFYARTLPAAAHAAVDGRDGLGTIIIKSAGNEDAAAQGDMLNTIRHVITVGATDDDGDVAWYSNSGANLLVTAPSSGGLFGNAAIKTTDLTGFAGFALGDYTGTDAFTGFGGTSAAAPAVAGVAALMLDANPGLGWRDVQEILAYSATHAGTAIGAALPSFGDENHAWRFNGADNWNGGGLHVSEDYGFGDIDVLSAVRLAEVWHLFGTPKTSANETAISREATDVISIGTATTIDLDLSGQDMTVEQAEVSLSLSSSMVDVALVSASGTRVELLKAGDAPAGPLTWTFGAQLFRGEDVDGTWHLEINNATGDEILLSDYRVDWAGQGGAAAGPDIFHYTDEIFVPSIFDVTTGTLKSITADPARTTLADAGGTDWLDFAAMTGNLDVDLADGIAKAFDETFLSLEADTDIEHAVTGDGHDRLSGNALDNHLYGMRGDDDLFGRDGTDWLVGGRGNDDMWGGGGGDTFFFADMFGSDMIHDFASALNTCGISDIVDFRGLAEASSLTAVLGALRETADGTVYDLYEDGENVVTFVGLNIDELSAEDFLIA